MCISLWKKGLLEVGSQPMGSNPLTSNPFKLNHLENRNWTNFYGLDSRYRNARS